MKYKKTNTKPKKFVYMNDVANDFINLFNH